MVPVSECIRKFLHARKTAANADLVDRWSIELETQVNVAAGNGEPVAGKRSTWSDGINEWFNVRIPKNAATDPSFNDYPLKFPLDVHTEGIGMTGWRWSDRRSLWFGYDFDALVGHAKGIGITDEDLAKVREAACALPYVEVRRSTGGGGLHLYVYLAEGVPCENHTEHAALARCVLGMMSAECNFDFASQIDAAGHVMWVWHRKMSAENHGLEIIKPAERPLTVADLPANWKDHIEVVKGRRSKVRINEITDEQQDPFEALASSRKLVPLDESHKAQIESLMRSGYTTLWVADHHLLQTHTCALQRLLEEERKTLGLVGVFKTISEGRDKGSPNCFLFPLTNGGWRVFRFSPGINEADTWTQSEDGWTTCYYNRLPDLATAARLGGAAEDTEKDSFVFRSVDAARSAVEAMDGKLDVPAKFADRKTSLRSSKDGRLLVEIRREKSDKDDDMPGWVEKGTRWVRTFDVRAVDDQDGQLTLENVRALKTPTGESAGLLVRQVDGSWARHNFTLAKAALQSLGLTKMNAEICLGGAVLDPYLLVNQPFQPAWLPGRRCNIDAAQFRVTPEEGEHPNWDRVFHHTFAGLTEAIKANPWFAKHGIVTGADYGRTWYACLIQAPFEPLPFLSLVGNEGSGKSIVYEAARDYLFTSGVVSANRALAGEDGFNGELEGALLAYVEEISLAGNTKAHARMKEWTTAKTLPIRRMRQNLYHAPSSVHFIMCANYVDHVPVKIGDTRVVVCWVDKPANPIPKKDLCEALEREAPAFLYTLKTLTLPPIIDRLRLPVVETTDKTELAEMDSPLSVFLDERCRVRAGLRTLKDEFRTRYGLWCDEHDVEPMKEGPLSTHLKELTGNRVRPKRLRDEGGRLQQYYVGLELLPQEVPA